MPYSRESYFDPSSKYRRTWSLTPQGRTLTLSGHKTSSMYATLSSAIPIFYVLMILAITFDFYLGFSILAKSGVNLGLIIISVLADLFLAVLPFLLGVNIAWLNHINNENELFKLKLECMTRKRGITDDEHRTNVSIIKSGRLKELKSNKTKGKIIKYITILLIFGIAGWKIMTFYSVLPPGISIFSVVNGKIVILFSVLCAIFHILGSEKAFSHLIFWTKSSEFNQYNELNDGQIPEKEIQPIDYEGNYKPAKYKNTEIIVDEDGSARIEYIKIIWDDEIQELMDRQSDEKAKRGVAITCKLKQIF